MTTLPTTADISESEQMIQWLSQKAHLEALFENRTRIEKWEKYKRDHEGLIETIPEFRKNLKVDIMVPLGTKALMRGQLVHTNEILVSIGDGWFTKQSGEQALSICQRRLKKCDEFIEKLGKERKLLEDKMNFPTSHTIFGGEDVKEIIETVDEQQEKEWEKKHRESLRKHAKEMALHRETIEKDSELDNDTWSRLEELELQEELNGELDRLGISTGDSSSELDSDDISEEEVTKPPDKVVPVSRISQAIGETVPLHDPRKVQLPSEPNQDQPKKISKFKASRLAQK